MALTILEEAQAGKTHWFLQFGGQGAPWYKELAGYYNKPEMKKFFDVSISAIENALSMVGETPALPHGLPLKQWLEDASSIPSDEYLFAAGVSLGMINITQLAHYENLHQQGLKREYLLQYAKGASGHSQGEIPATLAAMQLNDEQYYDAMYKYVQYLFLMGIRAQEVFPYINPTEEEIADSESLGNKPPAPMVAVLGKEHSLVEEWVKAINEELPEDKQIYVSLYNSPTNRILSSYRSSLIEFNKKYKAEMEANEMKYIYLRSTCPFHSPLMEPIIEKFAPDIQAIGFDFKGSDLSIPVYSFADGHNLQEDDEIAMVMLKDLMVRTLYWDYSVKPIAQDSSINLVIDFGPGKTTQRLTTDTLKGMGVERTVLCAAVPKDLKKILA